MDASDTWIGRGGSHLRHRLRELGAADIAAVQRWFEANPEYFWIVNGEGPRPGEAQAEFVDVPPAGMPYRKMLLLGFYDGADTLVGVATIVSDFIVEHVWHIGLFVVATALHGSGAAHALYRKLERWMVERGAQWIRLGVVVGSSRAERFWERSGYVETRRRGPLEMGKRSNLLRVMVKPLAGGSVADYLDLVARDRPGSP